MNPSVTKIDPLHFRALAPQCKSTSVQTRKLSFFNLIWNQEEKKILIQTAEGKKKEIEPFESFLFPYYLLS